MLCKSKVNVLRNESVQTKPVFLPVDCLEKPKGIVQGTKPGWTFCKIDLKCFREGIF